MVWFGMVWFGVGLILGLAWFGFGMVGFGWWWWRSSLGAGGAEARKEEQGNEPAWGESGFVLFAVVASACC